jgi:hypothetical protein
LGAATEAGNGRPLALGAMAGDFDCAVATKEKKIVGKRFV